MFSLRSISVLSILLVLKITEGQTCLNQDIIDPSYVNVEFTPLVRSPAAQFLYGYRIKDIQTMIELVSTRFQKFSVMHWPPPADGDNEPVFRSIPKLIAEYNLLHNNKLEVTLSSDLSHNLSETLDLVNETNSIFSGTVKRIMLDVSETQTINNNTLIYLKEAEKRFSEIKIKTGIKIKLSQCDKYKRLRSGLNINSTTANIELPELPPSVTLPETTWNMLIFVDFVVFTPNSVFVIDDSPAETTMGYLTKQFEICSGAVKWTGHKVDVHFGFAWSSEADALERNANNLVQYWKLLGNWAKGRGRKKDVYLIRAFDLPFLNGTKDKESLASQGWWRILNPDSPDIAEENFREKICDLSISEQKVIKSKQNLDYTFKKYESTGESGNWFVLIIIWILVIMTNVAVIVGRIIAKASKADGGGGNRGQGLTGI